ncbi:MAG: hypothetical protein FJY55_06670 [Betaproteobacteria bacterium]|nr:hypothetical protein [Betaproteobacteria bacterium]
MEEICRVVDRPMMANMVRGGHSPDLSPQRLRDIGFRLAVYPMIPFGAAIHAMRAAVEALRDGLPPALETNFGEIKTLVGFDDYYATEQRYVA